jgi:hypothetical protein
MANLAVFPAAGARARITVADRVYTCAIGSSPILVPDFDAFVLCSNGWLRVAADGAGTTVQRPARSPAGTPVRVGFEYYDSDVGAAVIWNGKNWINHSSSAIA